jgi:TPR repeat protein
LPRRTGCALLSSVKINSQNPRRVRCAPQIVSKSLRLWLTATFVVLSALMSGLVGPATASSVGQGKAAYARQDYALAAKLFIPSAQIGNPTAQAYLGYMFETGRGVPQNLTEAAYWYRRAAEQGDSKAQYLLGLLYDKGFGVTRDLVEANKWLNLSAAGAPPQGRDVPARLRDAVLTKMTRGEIAESRRRALEWHPVSER